MTQNETPVRAPSNWATRTGMGEAQMKICTGRRNLVTLVGGVTVWSLAPAAAWSLAVLAQQPGKIWRVGFIAHTYESFYDAFFQGLLELGYTEGQNIIYERRYAEGRAERFEE